MQLRNVLFLGNNLKLVLDGEFENLALIKTDVHGKTISFIESKKYIEELSENITCIFTTKELLKYLPSDIKIGIITCENPKIEFFKLHNYLYNNTKYKREKLRTIIGNDCHISKRSVIAENNVQIGNNVTIEENVIVREDVKIGDNSIIRAGSIIGGEGFDCKKIRKESIMTVVHAGGVNIGENVEVQYNCCIDKAVFPWDNTVIGNYTKIDNLVHIAHASKIGSRCLLVANSSIGGSTIIGNDCWVGVGATISNNLIIGNNCSISIGAVVTKDIESGKRVSGNFAISHSKFIEFIKKIR